MAAVSTFVIAGAALAIGASAYGTIKQAEEAKKMRKNAEATAAQQYQQQQELIKMEKEKTQKLEQEKANETARIVGNQQRDAASVRAGVLSNRQGINTSSLGVTGQAQTAGKTALGT